LMTPPPDGTGVMWITAGLCVHGSLAAWCVESQHGRQLPSS
jgi:hypothetical protein